MNAEEELNKYKQQTRKRARQTAIVFGLLAVFALSALSYAFIQDAALIKASKIAEANVAICREEIEARQKEVDEALRRLEQALIETNIAKSIAADCAAKKPGRK